MLMRYHAIMAMAGVILLCGCGAKSQMNAEKTYRILETGQVDIRDYTEADFSSGLEGAVVQDTGAADAHVFHVGKQYYAALQFPSNQPFQASAALEKAGARMRNMLGFRAAEIHLSSDPSAFAKLEQFSQRISNGEVIPSTEMLMLMQEWELNEARSK